MLAPGEYLIKQSETAPVVLPGPSNPTPLATPVVLPAIRTAPAAPRPEEPEPRSFLLTLLRALGAVHT